MTTKIDATNPLYLHPSEGTSSISVEKLEGSSNYRAWRRSFEISLASKRKLGFVTGGEKKDISDKVKSDAWDTCNSMVISWLLGSLSEPIKRSVMFMHSAHEIWRQLELRFTVTNGARKYMLSKAIYETKQSGRLVADYYTEMRSLWEELDDLKDYPAITTLNVEISAHLSARQKDEEEQRLFQLLNGLDDDYGTQRSHILMMSPLPTVDNACGILQQEESHKEIHKHIKTESDGLAMYSRRNELSCTNCGKTGHTADKCWACKSCGKAGHTQDVCWTVVGYPNRNNKGGKEFKNKGKKMFVREQGKFQSKWNQGRQDGKAKMSANSCSKTSESSSGGITAQQLEEKLLRMLPLPSKEEDDESDDEMEANYAEMIECNLAHSGEQVWIIDSGATHHMTGCRELVLNGKKSASQAKITLPNGEQSEVTHTGEVKLGNNLYLKNVMYIPSFRHSLISVQKLALEQKCKVMFLSNYCIIQDEHNGEVKGIGRAVRGVYHLLNQPVKKILQQLKQGRIPATEAITASSELSVPAEVGHKEKRLNMTTLWHKRLGHAPIDRIKHIKGFDSNKEEVCLTCPLAKFTKLPFKPSQSRAAEAFELVHIDTWRPYRISTREGYRYFLTVIDDHTRVVWVHLMKSKDEAYGAITKFINMADTQYNKKVKRVRSDNALEFKDKLWKALFNDQGIVHETTCVDRPEQNGRAERRHRNLLEMGRSLRFQSGLPPHNTGESVYLLLCTSPIDFHL